MLSALLASADHLVAAAHVRPHLARMARPRSCDARSIAQLYDRAPFFVSTASFETTSRSRVAFGRALEVVDLAWTSDYAPLAPSRYTPHRRASARLLRARGIEARGAVMLVPGYLGGRLSFEERVWPVRAMLDRGYDVAFATLPPPTTFPSSDPVVTIEGTRQAIHDLRALLRFLKEHAHAKHVGAMGMSLGGYVVALLATIEPSLAFAVPVIPLADLSDFADGRFSSALRQRRDYRSISPFTRRSLVPGDSVRVIGAEADAIAPVTHARALALHFGSPLETFVGGHILQVGRAAAFRRVLDILNDGATTHEPR